MMYVQDHEETFPNSISFWQGVSVDPGVLVCPTKGKNTPNGYCAIASVMGKSLGDFNDPSSRALTVDGPTVSLDTWTTSPLPNIANWTCDYEYRHSGAMIVSYLDGHVGSSQKLLGAFDERLSPLVTYDFNTNPFSAGNIVSDAGNNCLEIPAINTESKPSITVTSGQLFNRLFAESSNPNTTKAEFCVAFKIKRTVASTNAGRSGWFEIIGEWFHNSPPGGTTKINAFTASTAMFTSEPYLSSMTEGWKSYDYTTWPAFRFKPPYYVSPNLNYYRFYMTFHNKNLNASPETFRIDDFVVYEVLPG